MEVQSQFNFFYADNGLIPSNHPECLRGEVDTLKGMFDQVEIWVNVGEAARMLCLPCHAVGNQL